MIFRKVAPLAALILSLAGSGALAAPVAHTSLASWQAAVSGTTVSTETLEAVAVGDLTQLGQDLGLFSASATGTSTVDFFRIVEDDTLPTKAIETYLNDDGRGFASMIFDDFDSTDPVFGVGMDIGSLDADGITVTVNGIGLFFASTRPSFIGISDIDPITSLVFTSANEQFDVDNIRFASGPAMSAIPLPATGLLLLAGLGGMTALGRRRARAA